MNEDDQKDFDDLVDGVVRAAASRPDLLEEARTRLQAWMDRKVPEWIESWY